MTWWVVQTEAQREHIVRVLLMRARYETYIPRIKHRSRISPLFPSYLFVRIGRSLVSGALDRPCRARAHVRRSAGAIARGRDHRHPQTGIGGFVKLPAPPQLRKGQHVRVIRGSFEGLLAIHQGMGSRERVWVLLNLMDQQVAVELPSRDLGTTTRCGSVEIMLEPLTPCT